MQCLECGSDVPLRLKCCGGNQPGFCSDECRTKRKRKTVQRWVIDNRDKKVALDTEARARFNKKRPDYFREHYAKNRERRKRQSNEWYHANSARALEARKEYVVANPEKARRWGRKSANTRRAITKRVFVEAVDPDVVFSRDKGICGICCKSVDVTSHWEIDHIVPISKGGAHGYDNVQLAHRKCNRAKAARPQGQPTLFQVAQS